MPFLPGLSRSLFGERLALPSVATWWCGQPPALTYVRQNLDFLVIKPAFPARGMEPVFGGRLGPSERSRLLAATGERGPTISPARNCSTCPACPSGPRMALCHAASSCAFISPLPAMAGSSCPAGSPVFLPLRIPRSSPCSTAVAAKIPGFSHGAGRQLHPAPPARFAGRAASRRQQRPAQPRRRTSLLARPLRRALRAPGARAALHPGPA